MTSLSGLDADTDARRAVLGVLARATRDDLAAAWTAWPDKPDVFDVRAPETGLVMVRGRMGGGGRPFNLGETTVTRCTVRLGDGTVGTGHVLGRDRVQARLVAVFDALWQRPRTRPAVEAAVIAPVRARLAAEDDSARSETAATRVDFFTMVRGDD
ncbi:phosphonate C-P lyase system protein PhnG [Chthonobacter rhizosphaerae]|uniref:phosphonate C-P lyase system protein PhnG n=1 Tax=Chthonobacter rhizosphaerae TaxID=2735553 RepID=UPI0015EF0C82|nr:phosphonate C-P lyase system protein PhnG [Chthonobacter rhizosphaerae]